MFVIQIKPRAPAFYKMCLFAVLFLYIVHRAIAVLSNDVRIISWFQIQVLISYQLLYEMTTGNQTAQFLIGLRHQTLEFENHNILPGQQLLCVICHEDRTGNKRNSYEVGGPD